MKRQIVPALLTLLLVAASPLFALGGFAEVEGDEELSGRLRFDELTSYHLFVEGAVSSEDQYGFVGRSFRLHEVEVSPAVGYDGHHILPYLRASIERQWFEGELQLQWRGGFHHRLEAVVPLGPEFGVGLLYEGKEAGPMVEFEFRERLKFGLGLAYHFKEKAFAPRLEVRWGISKPEK